MSLKQQALTSVLWTGLQQFGSQGINFIVSIILARLIAPAEFGILALIYIFTGIAAILTFSGLGASIVRSEHVDDEDYSTVFIYNLIVGIVIYIVLFLSAPWVADYYEQPILTKLIRLYTLIIPLGTVTSVQLVRFQKQLKFKVETYATLISSVLSAAVGIWLAMNSYGVFSLVWMGIVGAITKGIYVWVFARWFPKLKFNKLKFNKHFKFGLNLTFTGLLDVVFENIYNLYIGKFYSFTQLGYYNRADSLKQLPVNNVLGILGKITFPLFAKVSHDNARLKDAYRRVMLMVTFILLPIMVTAGVMAQDLITILFSAKWLPAVPYFQILCIVGVLHPLRVYNSNIFLVKGRSDLFFKLELFKKIIFLLMFFSVINYGIYGLLWGQVIFNLAAYVMESYFAGKFINYQFVAQLEDIFPTIVLGITVGAILYVLNIFLFKDFGILLSLLLGSFISASLYFILAMLFRNEGLKVCKNLLFP